MLRRNDQRAGTIGLLLADVGDPFAATPHRAAEDEAGLSPRRLGRQHTVALVGFDDLPLAGLLDPGVTVVARNPAELGRAAARALFRRMDGDGTEPREISIVTTLIPRGSGEISGGPTGSW
jgi:DNA-binding LacI/PurR family transcriptional regulator